VREQAAGSRPEVFWASAPDAFEVLGKSNLLQKSGAANPAVPAKVGSYPVNDPEGLYLGQALAGYGIMWNTRYVKANNIPEPKEWADLTKAVYFGHVANSSPSRSGTVHLTVETILQGEGWAKGWEQLLQISGNCAAITERSFGVPDGVSNGQFGVGPRDRLLRPGGQELRAAGGVRLPVGDRDRAGEHRAGGRGEEPGGRQALHPVRALRRGTAAAAQQGDQPPARAARRRTQGARRATRIPYAEPSRRR
jgi:hypothetical protein